MCSLENLIFILCIVQGLERHQTTKLKLNLEHSGLEFEFRTVACWGTSTLNFVCEKALGWYSVKGFFIDVIPRIFETPITDFISYS